MKKVLLLLVGLIALGCSKNENKEEEYNCKEYLLNVPSWLIGRWEFSSSGIDYSFEFSKDNYMIISKGNYFKYFCLQLINQKEHEYTILGKKYKEYSFTEYQPSNGIYTKRTFIYRFEYNGKHFFENKVEEVDKNGFTIKEKSKEEHFFTKVK